MANLQRSAMLTELQSRGWSRFVSTDLERYLDWALQDIYGMAMLPRSTLGIYNAAATVLDVIPFTTISGGGAELVQQVKRCHTKYSGEVLTVDSASESEFMEFMYPNTLAANPVKAAYPIKYFVYDLGVYFYPKPQAAIDLYIHYLLREDVFSGPTDTSGLPERFDKTIIAQAEVHCYRRAHEPEGYALAQATVRDFMLEELGMAGEEMEEKYDRVVPWRG